MKKQITRLFTLFKHATAKPSTMTPEEAGEYIERMNPPSEESKAIYEAIVAKYGPDATFGQVLSPDKDAN
jgi:hypothetical protein